MQTSLLIALLLYFAAMLLIGVYAYRRSTDDLSGYLLGGRQLGPGVTALSAGASDMSGWIIMGLPGAVYLSGLSNIWIGLGLVVGAYLNYLLVAPRLRAYTEIAGDSITLPDFFENRFEDSSRLLRIVASIVIIVFFTVYTSSGLVGGGKLFETAFNQSYELGLYVTAGVVVLYTLFGGFLAVSMTDFVQGCIMFIALILVPTVAILNLGGVGPVIDTLSAIDAKYLSISNLSIAAVISSLAWGLGYFGQPHIIVRFMAIRSVGEIKVARRIGMSWIVTCLVGAMATGFVGIAFIHQAQVSLNDPEAIFILLSQLLFHPFITGFLLAAVLAAIMSTVSSQLLVTSSSLTEDIYKAFLNKQATEHQLVFISRLSVVAVAMLAIYLAHNRDSSILQLVSHAWAGFGAAFGPMILLSLYWPRMTAAGALAGIVVGAATVLVWIYAPISIAGQSLSQIIYAMVPGVLLSALAIVLISRLTKTPSAEINTAFLAMESRVKSEL
jgi:SSS family solute:Na+ symporter/sodium/proline symporter